MKHNAATTSTPADDAIPCLCGNTYYSRAEYIECAERHIQDLMPRRRGPAVETAWKKLMELCRGNREHVDLADFEVAIETYLRERIRT